MFQIVEKKVQLEFPQGHHLHCMICQVPNQLGQENYACKLTNPAAKWQQIRSILELVATGKGNLRKQHFLVFPEAALPYQSLSEMLDFINDQFAANTVTIIGIEHIDLLCVLECNPKPEHKAFRDVVNGFYGEYLAYTPGVRDTTTVFCNSSDETNGLGDNPEFTFGHSMVIMHQSHKITASVTAEFQTDDFNGLPVCRLRFGTGTRLFYFNLPLFHELDPRTTRFPLKVHAIYQSEGTNWDRLSDVSTHLSVEDHDFAAARRLDAAEYPERPGED